MRFFLATMFSILLLQGSALQAQGVYVTPGEKGPVFSDKAQPGAREVRLPPLNIVAPQPQPQPQPQPPVAAAGPGDRARSEVAAVAYRSFSIVQPENNGSVLANTALFEVRVAVDPPLLLGEGHAFAVSINGRPVSQRFTASEFIVPPEFWGDVAPPSGQSLQLDASIVDREGRELKKAAPVRFVMRYAPQDRRLLPVPPPRVSPKRPDKAVGEAIK